MFFGIFTPILGEKIPNLTNIFQLGWNHQLATKNQKVVLFATVLRWSLGVLTYELNAGHTPWDDEGLADLFGTWNQGSRNRCVFGWCLDFKKEIVWNCIKSIHNDKIWLGSFQSVAWFWLMSGFSWGNSSFSPKKTYCENELSFVYIRKYHVFLRFVRVFYSAKTRVSW